MPDGQPVDAKRTVRRRVRLKRALQQSRPTVYSTSCESRLTARRVALIAIDDVLPRPYGCRDVTDGALGSSEEGQGARATSSGGSYSTVMHCIHPVQGPGANEPVAGGPPDDEFLRDR